MVEERVVAAVQKIVDVYTSDEGTRYFRISWKDTWEPESHLLSCEEMMTQFWKDKKQKMIDDYEKDVYGTGTSSTDTCSCGAPIPNNTHKRKPHVNASTQCLLVRRKVDVATQVCRNKKKRKESSSSQVVTESDSGGDRIQNSMKRVLNMSAQNNVDVMSNESTLNSESGNIQLHTDKTKTDIGVQVKSKVKSKSSQVVLKNVDLSVQVDTDMVDISLQAGPAFTHFKDESSQAGSVLMDHKHVSCQTYPINNDRSIQVGTSMLKSKYISTQSGPDITHLKDDFSQTITFNSNLSVSTQAGAGVARVNDISVQTSTNSSSYGIDDELSSLDVSNIEGSNVQYSVSHIDQDCQYEKSFSEYFDDGGTLQKEVAVQCCPLTYHCGIQTIIVSRDESTQSYVDGFNREIGCQFAPRTSSCGVQKNVLGLDKCCQYEAEAPSLLSSPRNYTPMKSFEKIVTKKESPQSVKNTPVKRFQNETVNENVVRRNEQCKASEDVQTESQLFSRVAVNDGEGELKDWKCLGVVDQRNGVETKMKEIMILTDVPLGLRSNDIIDENGSKVKNKTTSSAAATITSINSFDNMEQNVPSAPSPSVSQTDTSVSEFLTVKTANVIKKNLSIFEAVTPTASQSSRNIFPHPPASASTPLVNSSIVVNNESLVLKQPNYPNNESLVLRQSSNSHNESLSSKQSNMSTKRTPLKCNDGSTLKKVTFMDQMVSLDAYSDTNLNNRTPVKRKLDTGHDDSSSSPKTSLLQDFNDSDVIKKQKRGDVTKKVKRKKKTRMDISLEDRTPSNDICLPLYEIMTCNSANKELEHISAAVSYDHALKTDIVKYANETEAPSSDGNEINDDFISRYWK